MTTPEENAPETDAADRAATPGGDLDRDPDRDPDREPRRRPDERTELGAELEAKMAEKGLSRDDFSES